MHRAASRAPSVSVANFREDRLYPKIERAVAFGPSGVRVRFDAPWWFWNLFGEQAVFLLSRKG